MRPSTRDKRDKVAGPRRIGSGRQPVAPVKEKQERQQGSTGHQDFQQEIGAQLPPSSMQDFQTNQDYLHLRLPLASSPSKPSRSSLPSRTGGIEIDRPAGRSYSMPGSEPVHNTRRGLGAFQDQ